MLVVETILCVAFLIFTYGGCVVGGLGYLWLGLSVPLSVEWRVHKSMMQWVMSSFSSTSNGVVPDFAG